MISKRQADCTVGLVLLLAISIVGRIASQPVGAAGPNSAATWGWSIAFLLLPVSYFLGLGWMRRLLGVLFAIASIAGFIGLMVVSAHEQPMPWEILVFLGVSLYCAAIGLLCSMPTK